MDVQYYNRAGCGGGCLLLLLLIFVFPLLLLVRLFGGKPAGFGTPFRPRPEPPRPEPPDRDDESPASDAIVDIEAREVDAENRRLK